MSEPHDTTPQSPWHVAPETPDDLHAWLIEHLSIMVVREPMDPNHNAPFEYLCHAFFEDRLPRDCVVWANRGGGKTFYAAVATLLDLVFKAGIEIRILGGSLEQSKRMHAHLRGLFAIEPFDELIEGKITERRLRLVNGSSVELLAQSQTSVRGTRVQKLRCDELELFDREVWEAAQLTTREMGSGTGRVRGSIECFSTMHVPYGLMHELIEQSADAGTARRVFKWGLVDVLDACDERHTCISDHGPCPLAPECAGRAKGRKRQPTNPSQTPGHISIDDAIALKSRVGQDTWNSEMLCLRPQRSDCVLPEFDDGLHVVDRIPHEAASGLCIAGMDFGIRSPTVVLFARVDTHGVIWVVDEHVQSDRSLDEHIAVIKGHNPAPVWLGVDPAGRQRGLQTGISDVQAMRRAGLVVKDRLLGLHEGLKLIRARLKPANGGARLYFSSRCEQLIDSVRKYHYPKDQPFCDTPEKDGHDHCVDALRYMLQNLDRAFSTQEDNYIQTGGC
ncbi:MAG: hypothetical protein ACF8MF_13740 [Phycisphaerales bacterium JB052]